MKWGYDNNYNDDYNKTFISNKKSGSNNCSFYKKASTKNNKIYLVEFKPEDQWSCKRSPDYFPGINTTVKREKGATSIF